MKTLMMKMMGLGFQWWPQTLDRSWQTHLMKMRTLDRVLVRTHLFFRLLRFNFMANPHKRNTHNSFSDGGVRVSGGGDGAVLEVQW
ncbi:hypothetical protein Hanom_Chr04g00301781 [Helianthus anomalus]